MSKIEQPARTVSDPEAHRLDRYVLFDPINRAYTRWQLEQVEDALGQRILEVGCGVGGIIDLLGRRELIFGIEVEEEVLSFAKGRFQDRPECRFAQADIVRLSDDLADTLQRSHFDSVVCMNVLEHIEDDVAALRQMAALLVPGGRVALLVPAGRWLYGEYDRLDGHYRRYNRRMLQNAITQAGLRVTRLHYFNSVGAIGWWVQYKVLRRTIHGEVQFGVMNRLLPAVRFCERLVKPPFGLSLIAVCQKE
jgi:2-polyprenyl-3-methyl-5-hydroxy-6-metoxy-1,4-benzoquinol methylase